MPKSPSRASHYAVTGADLSWRYLSYLPITASAWRKFSNTQLIVGLVSSVDTNKINSIVSKYCHPFPIEQLIGLDPRVQAKISRMWIAQTTDLEDNNITIADLDMVPLSDLRNQLLRQCETEQIIKWGYDHPAYQNLHEIGKWPMDGTTAQGKVFRDIINPSNLNFQDLANSWDIDWDDDRSNPFNQPTKFSDESLLFSLTKLVSNQIRAKHLPRKIIEQKFLEGRIDRSSNLPLRPERTFRNQKIFEFHGPVPFPDDSPFGKALLSRVGLSQAEYLNYKSDVLSSLNT